VGSDAGIGQQVREPAPPVGGLEGDFDRLGLQLPEDAPELCWALPIRRDTMT
jgi:hypothetical protein